MCRVSKSAYHRTKPLAFKRQLMQITFAQPSIADAPQLVEIQIRAFHDDTRLYGVPLDGPPGYDSVDSLVKKLERDLCHKVMCDDKIVGDIIVFDYGEGHY